MSYADQLDVERAFSDRERTDALAIHLQSIIERSVRRIVYGRERLTEIAIDQRLQVARQSVGVLTRFRGLQVSCGRYQVNSLDGTNE